MRAKEQWAKSANGPDWLDVMAAMKALDEVHTGVTMVTILPVGIGSGGGLRVAISTNWEPTVGSREMPCVITERVCNDLRVEFLPAFVLTGIYAHDFAVGEAYQQASLKL